VSADRALLGLQFAQSGALVICREPGRLQVKPVLASGRFAT
jgi:hypothetical protein